LGIRRCGDLRRGKRHIPDDGRHEVKIDSGDAESEMRRMSFGRREYFDIK
jgi:hypothetical protein